MPVLPAKLVFDQKPELEGKVTIDENDWPDHGYRHCFVVGGVEFGVGDSLARLNVRLRAFRNPACP